MRAKAVQPNLCPALFGREFSRCARQPVQISLIIRQVESGWEEQEKESLHDGNLDFVSFTVGWQSQMRPPSMQGCRSINRGCVVRIVDAWFAFP